MAPLAQIPAWQLALFHLADQMPWPTFSQMIDTELQAIWAYLQSLPALPDNP